jgi:two-component system sensor histidine kinase FlrB
VAVSELLVSLRASLDAVASAGAGLDVRDRSAGASVQVDRQALVGAVCNLVENAWQAGGDVIVETACVGDGLLAIDVRDNGPGIDPEDRTRIFEPFFTRRAGGTGLGLAVVRSVVEAHHGDLILKSTPGQGSCFTLTLPRVASRDRHERPLALAGGLS